MTANNQSKATFIIDDREHAILPYLKTELKDIPCKVERLEVGDYNLVIDDKIICTFERKSLVDFSSSLSDGRHYNKDKLVEMRRKNNCRVIYIVEGNAFPGPNETFGRKPYYVIESAMFHLTVRDNISIYKTKDILDTAKWLKRFYQSMLNLFSKNTDIIDKFAAEDVENTDIPLEKIGATETPYMELLKEKTAVSDLDLLREIWSAFPGISATTADVFISQYSVSDIIGAKIPAEQLRGLKYPTGRAMSSKVTDGLRHISHDTQVRILSKIPGISTNTAKAMLKSSNLARLLSYSADSLSIIQVGERKLGKVKAETILRLLNLRYKKENNEVLNTSIGNILGAEIKERDPIDEL